MRAPSRPFESLVIKASLLGQGRQAPSSRPSQRDRGRTDGGLRAHSGGLAPAAAGYPSLGGVGVDLLKLFAFLRGTSSSRGAWHRALSALPCTPSQNPLTTDLPARPWAHGQCAPFFMNPPQTLAKWPLSPARPQEPGPSSGRLPVYGRAARARRPFLSHFCLAMPRLLACVSLSRGRLPAISQPFHQPLESRRSWCLADAMQSSVAPG